MQSLHGWLVDSSRLTVRILGRGPMGVLARPGSQWGEREVLTTPGPGQTRADGQIGALIQIRVTPRHNWFPSSLLNTNKLSVTDSVLGENFKFRNWNSVEAESLWAAWLHNSSHPLRAHFVLALFCHWRDKAPDYKMTSKLLSDDYLVYNICLPLGSCCLETFQ